MLSSPLSPPSLAPVPTALSSMASGSSKEEPAGQAPPTRPRRAADSPQVLLPLPCKKGEELQYHNFKCPECRAQLGSKAELVSHFQEVKAESDTVSAGEGFLLPVNKGVRDSGSLSVSCLPFSASPTVLHAVLTPHDAAKCLQRCCPPACPQAPRPPRLP